ncbi:MAG: 2Fe-2S iron-sulfur cluster-binding protein [Bacteriovorax sp.]
MKRTLTVLGLASKKIVKSIPVPEPVPKDLTLMDFLVENGITIASSCAGAGRCRKCVVNQTLLSCQITLKLFINNNSDTIVEISYL